jgi:hypothetical protein
MFKRIHFFVLLGIFASFAVHGQKTSFSVPDKIKGKAVYSEVLGIHRGYYFVVRYDKKANQNFLFEKYNKDLKVVRKLEFSVENGVNVEDIHLMHGQIFFMYSDYSKTDKVHKLYCDVYDESFESLDKANLIASTSIVPSKSKVFKISYDRVYHQIAVLYAHEIVSETVKFNILLMDELLQTISNARATLEYNREFEIDHIQLFNKQFSALVSTEEKFAKMGRKKLISFFYYNLDNDMRRIRKLLFDTVKFDHAVYRYDVINNAYLFSGFYSRIKEENIEGMSNLYFYVGQDSMKVDFIPFSEDMLRSISGNYDISGLLNYYPKGLVLRDDGGFVLISEYYSIQKEIQNDYYAINNTYVKYYYHFSDIMLISVNQNGQIDWNKIIRKDQRSMNDDGHYSSFSYAAVSGKIVLLFNDFSRTKWNLLYNEVNPDGEIDFQILVNGNNFNGSFVPRQAKQVGLYEIMLPAIDQKRGFTLLKINLQ